MTTKTKPLTQRQAEQLWSELRDLFVNAEQAIVKIIESKAWEPLGYDTFAQAWAGRMSGVRLAASCTAHVVYALLAEGIAEGDAATLVGMPPPVATRLRQQRDNGVPASSASLRAPRGAPVSHTVVKQYERSKTSSEPRLLHLELEPGELADLKALCDARGLDLKAEALRAIRKHFARFGGR